MDKASAYGAGDCRFESCRGHYASGLLTPLSLCVDGSPLRNSQSILRSAMRKTRCKPQLNIKQRMKFLLST